MNIILPIPLMATVAVCLYDSGIRNDWFIAQELTLFVNRIEIYFRNLNYGPTITGITVLHSNLIWDNGRRMSTGKM